MTRPHIAVASGAVARFISPIDRIPPSNLEAEMALLGSILVDKEMMAAVSEIVQPSDFYASLHESIFLALFALYERGEPLDKVSLAEELRNRGMLDKIGGMAYLNSLMDTVPTAASAEYYARIVREKSSLRGLIHAGTRITQFGYDGEGDESAALARAEEVFRDVSRRGQADRSWSGLSTQEIAEQGIPPARYAIEGVLTEEDGPALWFGPPGCGKSWLAMHALTCMVTQQPFAGRFAIPRARPVGLYFNFDAGPNAAKRRFVNDLRVAHPHIRLISPIDGWDRRQAENVLAQNPGAAVVFDCQGDMFRADPNVEQGEAARVFWRDLRALFQRYDCTGIVIDHANRAGGYYGSVQKLASVRQMVSVEPITDSPLNPGQLRARLACEKLSEAERFTPFDVILDFGEDGLSITVAGGAAMVETSTDRLLAKIAAHGPVTRAQVGADSGNRERGAKHDWLELVSRGAIVRTGTKVGKADLWWTPDEIRDRVLMGAPLHPDTFENPDET